MENLSRLYGTEFYNAQVEGSLTSARIFLGDLASMWKPGSVVDYGCGRGTWLQAARENGAHRLVGVDGDWAANDGLVDDAIEFHAHDLNRRFSIPEIFDMAISMEVAEHVKPESSDIFFSSLIALSGSILFSAAFIGQPGTNHINTRPHSYWARRFVSKGYQVFDIFRPKYWAEERVEPWYRQNAFLYVKPDHALSFALSERGVAPMANETFVDCLHPLFYLSALDEIAKLQRTVDELAGPVPGRARPVGRNAPCPCGSGKKYKACHGRS